MSDPTTHNRLYEAGRRAFAEGRPQDPSTDVVVREHTSALPVGDRLIADILSIWSRGYADARTESKEFES